MLDISMVLDEGCKIPAEEIIFGDIYCYSPSEHIGSGSHLVLQKYKEMMEEGKSFWEVVLSSTFRGN